MTRARRRGSRCRPCIDVHLDLSVLTELPTLPKACSEGRAKVAMARILAAVAALAALVLGGGAGVSGI